MRFISKKVFEFKNYIFLLLIFLLPTQLGKHFWPEWSLVNGIRVDYLSPTIYVTDILIIALFILTIFSKAQSVKRKAQNYSLKLKRFLPVVFFVLYLLLQAFFPSLSPLSLIKLMKIMEILVFAYLVKMYVNKKLTNNSFLFFRFQCFFNPDLHWYNFSITGQ